MLMTTVSVIQPLFACVLFEYIQKKAFYCFLPTLWYFSFVENVLMHMHVSI